MVKWDGLSKRPNAKIHIRGEGYFLNCKQNARAWNILVLYSLETWDGLVSENNTFRMSNVKLVAMATYCCSYHWLQGGLLGPYYAQLYSWCTVIPYSKMMIFKLCNRLLWIGNNYYKTAAELHYITFSVIIQWFLVPVPLLLDRLVFSLVKNANLRKKYFPFIKSRFVKKVSGHHPLPLEFLKSTQNFALYGVLHLIKFRKLIW